MKYSIEYYYASHIGKRRRANQDNFCCLGETMHYENNGTDGVLEGRIPVGKEPVFSIFDGMGGEECGEMAAYIAAEEMRRYVFKKGSEEGFFDFCARANSRICAYMTEHGIGSMGTTAAALRFTKKESCLCNIGDSKIFLFDGESLTQISYDHVGIAAYGRKPPLSQNLGIPEEEMIIEPYVALGSYREGDVYLICSDGITDMLTEDQIRQILIKYPGRDAAELLLEGALRMGGKDNITFILLYVKEEKSKAFWKK